MIIWLNWNKSNMKIRLIMITVLAAMVCLAWQHGKSMALKQLLDNWEQQDATHIDNLFDLQQLNAPVLDDVLTLKMDNAGLIDSINKLNK